MNKTLLTMACLALLLGLIPIPLVPVRQVEAAAPVLSVTASSDKDIYLAGEEIVLTGEVTYGEEVAIGAQVRFKIHLPDGTVETYPLKVEGVPDYIQTDVGGAYEADIPVLVFPDKAPEQPEEWEIEVVASYGVGATKSICVRADHRIWEEDGGKEFGFGCYEWRTVTTGETYATTASETITVDVLPIWLEIDDIYLVQVIEHQYTSEGKRYLAAGKQAGLRVYFFSPSIDVADDLIQDDTIALSKVKVEFRVSRNNGDEVLRQETEVAIDELNELTAADFVFTLTQPGDYVISAYVDSENKYMSRVSQDTVYKEVKVKVKEMKILDLRFWPIGMEFTKSGSVAKAGTVLTSDFKDFVDVQQDFIKRVYPLPNSNYKFSHSTESTFLPPHLAALWGTVKWLNVHAVLQGGNSKIVGVLPDDNDWWGSSNLEGYAVAKLFGRALLVRYDSQKATTAHELGHVLGFYRWYEQYGSFGYPPMGKEFKGLILYKGKLYDMHREEERWAAFGPSTDKLYSFMGNTGVLGWPREPWVGDEVYPTLFKYLMDPPPERVLYVAGTISTNGTVELDNWYTVEGEPDPQIDEGAYTIEVLASSGNALYSTKFAGEAGELGGITPFGIVVPFPDGASAIAIRQGSNTLRKVQKSPNPPIARVIYPNGGEVVTHNIEVRWSAEDRDGNELTYAVLYSADGGGTWTAVAVELDETKFMLDLSQLPGGEQALIKVIATDGFNTGQDISDGVFTVGDQSVAARIISPGDGSLHNIGEEVLLKGDAYGFGEELDSQSYYWLSSIDGNLGTGKKVSLKNLSAATHLITLTVRGPTGASATSTVTVTISDSGTTGSVGGTSFENAIELLPGQSLSGDVALEGWVIYKFHLEEDQRGTVTLSPVSTNQDMHLFLPEQLLWGWTENPGTDPDTMSLLAMDTGTYYAVVNGREAGDYAISLAVSPGEVTELSEGVNTPGFVGKKDLVWYKFYVDEGQTATVTLSPTSTDQSLYVMGYGGYHIEGSENPGTTPDQVTVTPQSGLDARGHSWPWRYGRPEITAEHTGAFYARAYGKEAGSYTISVSSSGGAVGAQLDYGSTITRFDPPAIVNPAETISADVTFQYSFIQETPVYIGIYDYDAGTFLNGVQENLSGSGSKTVRIDLTAPASAKTWQLAAATLYWTDGDWQHDEESWIQGFNVQVASPEAIYSSTITSFDIPALVNPGETLSADVTLHYSFSQETPVYIGIYDYDAAAFVNGVQEYLSGSGSKTVRINLTAPTSVKTWRLAAETLYWTGVDWQHEKEDWFLNSNIQVASPEATYSYTVSRFDIPDTVEPGETLSADVTLRYSFSQETPVYIGIYDYDAAAFVNGVQEYLSGSGSKTVNISLTAPTSSKTWQLAAATLYWTGADWQHETEDWYQNLQILVLSHEVTYSSSISDVVFPSRVNSGKTFSVDITIGYSFTQQTRVYVGIYDYDEEGSVPGASWSGDLSGTGSRTVSIALTAPETVTTWRLRAETLYWYPSHPTAEAMEPGWRGDEVGWYQGFNIEVSGAEAIYSLQITDVDYPSGVNPGETFSVDVTLQYSFTQDTPVYISIYDYDTQTNLVGASWTDNLSGTGSKTMRISLTAPLVTKTWHLGAETGYWYPSHQTPEAKAPSWHRNEEGWYQNFNIEVVQPSVAWLTYTDYNYNFSLEYPNTWQQAEQVPVAFQAVDPTLARTGLVVLVETAAELGLEQMSLEQYTEIIRLSLQATVPGYQEYSVQKVVTAQGLEVYLIVFTLQDGQTKAQRLIYVHQGQTGYNVTVQAPPAQYDDMEATIAHITNNFKVVSS